MYDINVLKLNSGNNYSFLKGKFFIIISEKKKRNYKDIKKKITFFKTFFTSFIDKVLK